MVPASDFTGAFHYVVENDVLPCPAGEAGSVRNPVEVEPLRRVGRRGTFGLDAAMTYAPLIPARFVSLGFEGRAFHRDRLIVALRSTPCSY